MLSSIPSDTDNCHILIFYQVFHLILIIYTSFYALKYIVSKVGNLSQGLPKGSFSIPTPIFRGGCYSFP